MIYQLQITTAVESKFFLNEFSNKFSWLKQHGCSLTIDQTTVDQNNIIIDLWLEGTASKHYREEDIIYIFKHQLAEFLSEHIIQDWENRLTWKEVNKQKRHYLPGDNLIVMDKAVKFLKHCNSNESLNLLMNYGRKNKMKTAVDMLNWFKEKAVTRDEYEKMNAPEQNNAILIGKLADKDAPDFNTRYEELRQRAIQPK